MMNDTDNTQPMELVPPSALEAISRAEVDMSIATARKFPRQLATVKQKMMSFATLDLETAESCFYTLPRGGKNIQGPSVRLAEIAVACYGNLRAGTRIIATVTHGESPHVVVQAVASDLENNISISIEKRRRITKKKNKPTFDEDDINLAANACSAIAFRDAVYKVVPLALVKPVFEAAKKVAIGDAKTLADRRARSLDIFGKMGVTKERVLAKLEKKSVEEIDLGDLEILLGLYNAIKEGEVNLDEAFPLATAASSAEEHKAEIPGAGANAPGAPEKRQKGKAAPSGPPAGQTAQGPANPPQGDANKAPVTPPASAPAQTPANPDEKAEADMGLAPQTSTAAAPEKPVEPPVQTATAPAPAETAPAPAAPSEDPKWTAKAGDTDEVASIKLLAKQSGVSYAQVLSWARVYKFAKEGQDLWDLSSAKLQNIGSRWATVLPKIKEQKA